MPFDIPHSIDEVLDDAATFEPGALAAVRAFARSKPWNGTEAERIEKFNACAAALAEVYGHPVWTVQVSDLPVSDTEARVFTMPKLSVVTFLHFMAAVRGHNPRGAFRWSVNIFKRCFPRSFAQCRTDGPFLRRHDEI